MLLYCIGPEAESVLDSTNITTGQRKKYDTVVAKLDSFFQVRKTTFERARFNRRCQGADESAEEYITALFALAETSNYGELRDELIRDRLERHSTLRASPTGRRSDIRESDESSETTGSRAGATNNAQ